MGVGRPASGYGLGGRNDARISSWGAGRRRLPGPLLPAAAVALLALGLGLPDLLSVPTLPVGSGEPVPIATTPSASPAPATLTIQEEPAADPSAAWPEPAGGPPSAETTGKAGTTGGAPPIEADTACPGTPTEIADVAMEARRRRDAALRLESGVAAREAALQVEAARLAALKAQLDARAAGAKVEDEARVGQLVKVYETMKPKDAAQVFDRLEMPVLLSIAARMREVRLASILAAMDPAEARAVTMALAAPARAASP
jgi:flagellar motility protein MotE (MotC chaperone)